jgi:hypothetical protein
MKSRGGTPCHEIATVLVGASGKSIKRERKKEKERKRKKKKTKKEREREREKKTIEKNKSVIL